jgi:hypothetical protein
LFALITCLRLGGGASGVKLLAEMAAVSLQLAVAVCVVCRQRHCCLFEYCTLEKDAMLPRLHPSVVLLLLH